MKEKIKLILRHLWGALSQNLGWKIFSFVSAVLLWSYITSSDPTITRSKTITGVELTTSGHSVLQSRDLALLTDPTTLLQDVRVTLDVPQAYYSRVSADTVHVELDLSQIRQTGRQEVELTGTSGYGTVVQIIPSKLEVVVEKLDQRSVPVNVELTGAVDEENYWYSIGRSNPYQLTVSGPSSIVQTLSSALVQLDVTGITGDYSWTLAPSLLNSNGEVVTQNLSRSSSSVTVGVSVYPTKELEVVCSPDTATVGRPAEGYQITRIEVQPETVTAAADSELLSQLESLTFTPVGVTGRQKSFSQTTSITKLKGIEYLSSEQVTVTVYIEEQTSTKTFHSVPLTVVGAADGQKASISQTSVSVKVTGPYSVVEELVRGDIIARADVTGLAEGEHVLPISVSVDNHPELTFEADPVEVSVNLHG